MDYLSVKEAAEKWRVTERWVQFLCIQNRIDGVLRFGKSWMIPKDAEKPADGRTKEMKIIKEQEKNNDNK